MHLPGCPLACSYLQVGFDSKASPIVGLLPTHWREWLLRNTLFASAK